MSELREYLKAQEQKTLLRFITCGSVDDGKSTLIGRLLYDAKLLFDDQLSTLEKDSLKHGTDGENIDFALLVDGLAAEREQGITIDVAYRFFATEKRKFIVADTPGHEQYTRNMATGASTADVAIILIDARKSLLPQTRRHSFIVSLLGIKHVVLAVNKIDLMDYDQKVFDNIVADYAQLAPRFGFSSIAAIPISARFGDNVFVKSDKTPWYEGQSLIDYLETIDFAQDLVQKPFRFAVQWVNRPNLDFRGFSGTLSSGLIKPGDEIIVPSSGKSSKVKTITTFNGDLDQAQAGQAVTLTLEDEIDISRGDLLASPTARPEHSDQFQAHLIWMSDVALIPSRRYILKIGAQSIGASVTDIRHKIDVNSFEKLATKELHLNEVAVVNIATQSPISFDPYAENHETGAFILIDRMTNQTLGAGMIDHGLRRASNVHWQALNVSKASRSMIKGQKPCVLWFTGLSGSGKSTIANALEQKLLSLGHHTYLLDGDNVRHGLNRDLGFTDVDRVENIRRVSEVSKLMIDAGLITLVSFISPFRAERQMAREMFGDGEFIEIYVSTPLDVAESRDVKGLYKRAREGQLKNFTGIDSPYEAPVSPDLTLDTVNNTPEALADIVVEYLSHRGRLSH